MTINPARFYGKDIACIGDADELFSEVEGIDVIIQDVIHVLTTDDFLGPGGAGRGFDLRRLIGKNTAELAGEQPNIVEVVERDDRINSAVVELTAITTANGLADLQVSVSCETEAGPFAFTKSVLELTSSLGDPQS